MDPCAIQVGEVLDEKTGNNTGPTSQGLNSRISSWKTFDQVVKPTGNNTYTVLDNSTRQLVLVPVVTNLQGGSTWPHNAPYQVQTDGIVEGGFAPTIGYAGRVWGDTARGIYLGGAVHYYLGVGYAAVNGVGGFFTTSAPFFGGATPLTLDGRGGGNRVARCARSASMGCSSQAGSPSERSRKPVAGVKRASSLARNRKPLPSRSRGVAMAASRFTTIEACDCGKPRTGNTGSAVNGTP